MHRLISRLAGYGLWGRALLLGVGALVVEGHGAARLPIRIVETSGAVITQSCRVRIPVGRVFTDRQGIGAMIVRGADLVVEFEPRSVLRGAPSSMAPDGFEGIGIIVDGGSGIVLRRLAVGGYRCGVLARGVTGLTVEQAELSGNFAQRLRSTSEAEDSGDWLFPHHNDRTKWRVQYGASLCVESSTGVEISGVRVRRSQNGIILDRVERARVFDNDCSFLSGWGLAMWRSRECVVSRNAFDFCVRGHVEGVYNRGQDSAGILCFEQCSDNVFVENSVTHGGDGFFGFAGREAIGEAWWEQEQERLRGQAQGLGGEAIVSSPELERHHAALGCNRNVLVGNDFSYAAAHGLELTFSKDNWIGSNLFKENAICGVWGGYSSGTVIVSNRFEGNGGMAYGLERGAINMEHAAYNVVAGNLFKNNRCGVHLWWDDDAGLLRFPGVKGSVTDVVGNVIASNRFEMDRRHPFPLRGSESLLAIQLRDGGSGRVRSNLFFGNEMRIDLNRAVASSVEAGCEPIAEGTLTIPAMRILERIGRSRPVGAREHLAGRQSIVMHEWGPWDHESPLIRRAAGGGGKDRFELRGFRSRPRVETILGEVKAALEPVSNGWQLVVAPVSLGVTPYVLDVGRGSAREQLRGTLMTSRWRVVLFPWTMDPRTNYAGWRTEAEGEKAVVGEVDRLDFAYGWGGPQDPASGLGDPFRKGRLGSDHFGMVARTRVRLPAGDWQFKVLSDDGVRVKVDGATVLENWTWHGPTTDVAAHSRERAGEVELEVEHFEIDGYAVLKLELEPGAEKR